MADNKLELVVTVEVDKTNQSIKSLQSWLRSRCFSLPPCSVIIAAVRVSSILARRGFRSTLVDVFGAGATPRELMAALEMGAVPSEDHCQAARTNIAAGKPEEVAASAIGLLVVLYSKWRSARNEFARCIGMRDFLARPQVPVHPERGDHDDGRLAGHSCI